MKIFKTVLLSIAGIIAVFLIIALFLKKNYTVSREVVIGAPKQKVFDYIKYLKNQNNYSKWARMDPAMKKTYRGTDGAPGFVSAWESKADSVGKGEQEIRKITDGKRVETEIRFKEPFESTSEAYMTTDSVGNNLTKVQWSFSGRMNYPMNLMFLFMDMDKMVGNDLQTGLNNLKSLQEKVEQ